MKSRILTAALVLGACSLALAQAPADGGPTPTGPTAIPLDGGASLLLAGGIGYGLKQLRARRQNRKGQ